MPVEKVICPAGDRNQEEFTARLTKGLASNYWKILDEKEALELRNPQGTGGNQGHYLPAGFVLKSQGSTRARLVLDPSSSLNGALLKAPNLEENISSVLRRIQGMPIIMSADIREAYFRLRISPGAKLSSLFLMDFDTQTQQLTAKVTPHSKMVTVQTEVSIMGVNQSGSFLSLSLQDLTKDIEDPILRYFLRYLRYLDDLQSGVVAEEIQELQKGVNLQDPALEM